MVVVMSPDATDEDIAQVVAKVEGVGGEAFVSKGLVRTIIGLVGDVESFHHLNLRTLRGVADVHRISDPYKLVSRQHHASRSTVWVGPADRQVPIGPDSFTFLAGPCAVETPQQGGHRRRRRQHDRRRPPVSRDGALRRASGAATAPSCASWPRPYAGCPSCSVGPMHVNWCGTSTSLSAT